MEAMNSNLRGMKRSRSPAAGLDSDGPSLVSRAEPGSAAWMLINDDQASWTNPFDDVDRPYHPLDSTLGEVWVTSSRAATFDERRRPQGPIENFLSTSKPWGAADGTINESQNAECFGMVCVLSTSPRKPPSLTWISDRFCRSRARHCPPQPP